MSSTSLQCSSVASAASVTSVKMVYPHKLHVPHTRCTCTFSSVKKTIRGASTCTRVDYTWSSLIIPYFLLYYILYYYLINYY